MHTKPHHAPAVIVFDGVCLLCSRWVRFLLAHGLDPDSPLSFLLVEDGRGYTDSEAIARVLRGLDRRRWRWLSRAMLLVPRWMRDPAYRFVARHRYRIFGQSRSCFVPTPKQRARFMP